MARDVLNQAVRQMVDILNQYVAEAVQIVQGENTYDIEVTPAYDESSSSDEMGIVYNTRLQDFLVDTQKMRALGMRDFARGDKVIRSIALSRTDPDTGELIDDGTDQVVYEVVSDGSEPAWRHMSRYRHAVRIHTKRTDYELIPPTPEPPTP